MKKALITGITGQDGSYLAEFLLEKDTKYMVLFEDPQLLILAESIIYTDPHINGKRLFLHYGDLADGVQMVKLIIFITPDEIYHLGAQSHVRVSFDVPEYTGDVTALRNLRILEAIREVGLSNRTVSIRHRLLKCLEWFKKCRRQKKPPFIHVLLTVVRRSMLISNRQLS